MERRVGPLCMVRDMTAGTDERGAADGGWGVFCGHPSHSSRMGAHLLGALCIVLGVAGTAYLSWRDAGSWAAAPLAAVVLGTVVHVVAFLRVRGVRYRVSERMVEVGQGLLRRRVVTHELAAHMKLRFHQTVVQRALGIGDLELLNAQEDSSVTLRGLPGAFALYETMSNSLNRSAAAG